MFTRQRSATWTAVLATVLLPIAASSARAQNTSGYYYETFRYGYNPGYYARRFPVPAPGSVNQFFGLDRAVSKTMPSTVTAGAYLQYASATSGGGPRAAGDHRWTPVRPQAAADTTALIELQVPDGAQVWFADQRTKQPGLWRRYVSPPLAPGKEYTYTVRVVWMKSGREVVEIRDIAVGAGDRLNATFPSTAAK
jgi:uncharacterized protein (TIGR03000 family)